jgi:hypothetical protein
LFLKNKRCEVDEKGLEAGDFVFSALKHGTSTDRFFFLTSTFITIGRLKKNIKKKDQANKNNWSSGFRNVNLARSNF